MEQLKLNMIPNGVNPVFHASQYDKGRQIRFVLDETLSSAEVTVSYRAKDGTEYGNVQMSVSGNTITDTIPEEVLTDYGIIEGEVNIDGIGSLNFFVEVEKDAYDGGVITTQTATGAIATFETNIETAFVSLKSDINPEQDLHGYTKPWSGGCGKNKVDFPSYANASSQNLTIQTTGNGGIKVTGTPSTSWALLTSQIDVNIPSGQAITFGITGGTLSHNVYLNLTYADSTTDTLLINSGNTSKTMTLAKNLIKVRLDYSGMSTSTNYNETFYPMLEYGSTQSAFEPYSNICPISGFSALNVTRTGKNLFNPSDVVEGYTSNTSGAINGVNTHNHSSGLIKVIGGEKYVITTSQVGGQWGAWYDASNNFISGFSGYDNPITAPNNAVYCRFTIEYNDNNPSYASNVMFEKGQTRSTYEPYNGQTATVNFGQTVYGGECDVANGKVEIDFANDRLDTKSWSYNSSRGAFNATFSGKDQTRFNEIICSCYENGGRVYSASEIASKPDKAFYTQNNSDTIFIKDSDYTDTTTWLNALGSNTICYPLATPTEITTTPENLSALSGQNNVYSDTNGDTTVEYYIEV